MSENDFNYNPNEEKDPLNSSSESREPDSKPEEPESDAASADTETDASSEDTQEENNPSSSGQEEQPKENPYQQQYQNPYSSYGQNQNSYGQNQSSYGQNQNSYGQNQSSYGQNQNSYGQNQSSYGQGQNSYGQNQSTYGQNQNSYGQNQSSYGQNQNSYGQNQGSYGQGQNSYGQYRNPYGTYNNPYGNNGNSYGYGQNQNQNHQQPYWSYQPYGNPNQPQNQQPKPPKKNRGLIVFLVILGILAVGTVTAFSIGGLLTTYEQKDGSPNTASSEAQPDNGASKAGGSASSQPKIEGKVSGNGTNPGSSGIVINQIPGGSPLSAKQVYKKVAASVVGVETQIDGTAGESGKSQGTGIIATSDGYVLTNAHVVNYSRANKVTVILHNSKQYAATVVGYDKTSDLAVLRINATNLTPAEFGNSDQLEVGDSVVAIGNPGGMDFASSLTGGMVSAVNRSIESHSDNGMTYIQTDAAINPGNSGGPLVNMYGQVIGINSNKIVATGYEGMGFSIPISKAKTVINDLIAHGYVSGRSRLGITAMTITEIQSQLSGYPTGVLIREIGAESDLKKSGVVSGDIITKADGQKVTSMEDLYAVLNKHKAGDTIILTIYSPGTSQTTSSTRNVKTKLLEDKGETQAK